ncbi:putative signaling protein [Methylophilaceae bacterium]|nr:putative signaling protein [Methylophilaceae bacterium]
MASNPFQPTVTSIHPVTLEFDDAEVELEYRNDLLPSLKRQARLGLTMGIVLWLLFSLLDSIFLPGYSFADTGYLHATIISLALLVIALTYLRIFTSYNQQLITLVALVSGAGLVVKMWLLPEVAVAHYFPGLMLLIFWCHTYAGLRFLGACLTTILISLAFDFIYLFQAALTTSDLVSYNLYLAGTNLLAAASSYSAELQGRRLFLGRRELDNERKHHLSRSLHDSLTRLPNRELLEDRLELAISQSVRDERLCAGLFIDLDGFKDINDTYGHDVGDMFLQEVSARLKDIMREADTLSRIGGDEFFVLARDIPTKKAAQVLGHKLLHQLQEPFILSDFHTIPGITASIGVCLFPYKHCTSADIVRRADHAMYKIKRGGKAGIAFAEDYEIDDSTA